MLVLNHHQTGQVGFTLIVQILKKCCAQQGALKILKINRGSYYDPSQRLFVISSHTILMGLSL